MQSIIEYKNIDIEKIKKQKTISHSDREISVEKIQLSEDKPDLICYHDSKCMLCPENCTFSDIKNKLISITLPPTDRLIINFHNEDIGIDVIFKIIDDITEYMTGEHGFNTLTDVTILYDENNCVADRYAEFF